MRFIEAMALPFAYPFMVRGLIAAVIVGAVCSVIGCYVVLRGMAFLGSAVAHSILPGLAIGFLVEGQDDRRSLFWWALGTSVLVALGVGAISRRGRVREDSAIGIVFAGMFALGIALISTVRGFAVDLVHFLFGNVLAVTDWDLTVIAIFGGGILLLVVLFYKEFLVISFDETLGRTQRLPVRFYQNLLLVLMAVTVAVSLQTVGVGLMLAMLVTPPAAALLVTRRLPVMMVVSAGIGALSGIIGLYVSFYAGIASGAAIVLVAMGFFLVLLGVSSMRPRRRRSPTEAGTG